MTFTIDQTYKAGVPRGQYYRGPFTKLESGSTSPLVVSPNTNPENWSLLIDTFRYSLNALSLATDITGAIEISYPDYVGENQVTHVFEEDELNDMVDELVGAGDTVGNYQHVVKFKPPILLRASNSETDLTIGLPTGQDISSGDISFLVTGWTIKESDYD